METIVTWLRTYEFIAIWLEGIALVAIFVLDWRERKDQRKDRKEQHEETVAQLKVSQEQVAAAQEQVEAAQKPCLVFLWDSAGRFYTCPAGGTLSLWKRSQPRNTETSK